ncbi:uncharacterized protein TNCV_650961 [Trichonephila clavipes]|nr:uncharacterized protein TNCV_650961 [Trichonephila clavipes]
MARIVRHNDESVRKGIYEWWQRSKIVHKRFKAFQCNNRIVMAQRKHLDDFLRGRIIGRLECGRTQLEVSEEIESPRVSSPGFGNDSKIMVMAPWALNFCLWMTTSVLKHCRRMPSIGGYHPYGLASILTGLESNRACVGYAWSTNCCPSILSHLSTRTSEGIA